MPAERTIKIPEESRVVFVVETKTTSKDRTVIVPVENRTVFVVDKRTTSADRTVYAIED
jgi:hypothetical protein